MGGELERPPDHVNNDGSEPESVTKTSPGSVSSNKPPVPASQDKTTDDHGLSADAAANATLGVS